MPALINQSWFYQIVLYVVIAVCFVPDVIGGFLQKPEAGARVRDRGSHFVFWVAIPVAIFFAFFIVDAVPGTAIAEGQQAMFWFGIALMLAGTAFRWYAIRMLGRFFTRTVKTRGGQYVVERGPYRLIRHPAYSGSIATFIGLGLAMTNWASLLLILAGVAVAYAYRVHIEEQALCADLGQPYRDYMRRTRRFVPHVW
ncbi:MAG TPA: isoprenylcysteine carboxylmethyltransferase family protein [Rhodanobacteraceae bacterium]